MKNVKVAILILVMALIVLSRVGYPKHEGAKNALMLEGFSMIETGRGGILSCGLGMDTFRTSFKAVHRNGIRVEGTVCEGLFSYPYIRVQTYIVKFGGSDGS